MLALALIKNPSNPEKHLQRHASSIMLSVNYHFPPVDSEDDPAVVGSQITWSAYRTICSLGRVWWSFSLG